MFKYFRAQSSIFRFKANKKMKSNELIIRYANIIYERRIVRIIPKRQRIIAEISRIIFIIMEIPTCLCNIITERVTVFGRFPKSTRPFPYVRIPLEFGSKSDTGRRKLPMRGHPSDVFNTRQGLCPGTRDPSINIKRFTDIFHDPRIYNVILLHIPT